MLIAVVSTSAQDVCGEFVQAALESVEQVCANTGRNQACYGNIALEVTPQPDAANFQFANLGDITDVASIQSMELSGLNEEAGTWGIVLMHVQANIPDTLPGQNVSILLFGNTQIRNAADSVEAQVPPEQEQTVTATINVNVRALPSTNAQILVSVSPNSNIIATGRTADKQWIRVRYDGSTGWISSQLLSGGHLEDLIIVDPDAQQYGPMQAFYFTSGIGQATCKEVPSNGMLVQTPEGVGEISLNVNEVEVNMGSTVFFRINDDRSLEVTPIEGVARVTSQGVKRTAVAGTRIEVPLNEGYVASDKPSQPESYLGEDDIGNLPIALLERDIEIEQGLDEIEFDLFEEYEAIFNSIEIEDIDNFFDYLDEEENPDVVDFLINDLGYTDFDDEAAAYIEDEFDIDLDDYGNYGNDETCLECYDEPLLPDDTDCLDCYDEPLLPDDTDCLDCYDEPPPYDDYD
jgi:hypothetical protein